MSHIIVNADPYSKIALQGYDTVAFHSLSEAVKGNPAIVAEYDGYKFLFSSEETKATFLGNPSRYIPAFGGYCGYGVSLGVLFPVEIDTWEVVGGQLFLQYTNAIKAKFAEQKDENLRKARENWEKFEATGSMS